MKAALTLKDTIAKSYTVALMALLGIFAFISAVLISWPALAYLASKVFM